MSNTVVLLSFQISRIWRSTFKSQEEMLSLCCHVDRRWKISNGFLEFQQFCTSSLPVHPFLLFEPLSIIQLEFNLFNVVNCFAISREDY